MVRSINGFSKLSKEEKINWIANNYFQNSEESIEIIKKYWNSDVELQNLHDDFTENTITNFYLPLGLAPNFLINDKIYCLPFVIEESSVVAAAANAAKFWLHRGGFHTEVIDTEKIGQVHFLYKGNKEKLYTFFDRLHPKLFIDTENITRNMQNRGGGVVNINLVDKTAELENYYQLFATFETLDSMGANFINSCLEQFALTLKTEALLYSPFTESEKEIEVIMSILSNYVPNCKVKAEVSCLIEDLKDVGIENPKEFAEKFVQAVRVAEIEPYRAVTHNKGIMNGIDAVVLATGNDFRAVEAGIHAFASNNGKYSSLSHATIKDGVFKFWLEIPLALGTVGGLTSLHPLVKIALQLLGQPSAKELMQIVAAAGLAQNFAALRSLTTTGIQKGHMKMHLNNILNQFNTNETEKNKVKEHFKENQITHSSVVHFIESLRA